MSINRAGTAWRGSPLENPRRNGQRCNATCWCHARSPITGVRNCNDSTAGRIRRDLPYSRQKSIAVAGPAGCGNATMMSMHAGIHRLQKRWHGAHCTNRLYAALTRLALQNYLLGLGHNGTHQRHLDVSGFEVHGLGEVRRGRSSGSGPDAAVSATDATRNAPSVFAALTGIQVAEVRFRKQGPQA
jgi:hypothetical protein